MSRGRKYWGCIYPPRPAAELAAAAREQEAMGLAGLWSYQAWGPPFIELAAAAMVTSNVKLGTSIAHAFSRSPLETALAAINLDTISDGRVVLGLGPSVRSANEQWFGATYGKPITHLREVIALIRDINAKLHTGTLGKWRGEYYDLDFSAFAPPPPPLRTRIPIFMSAVYETATQAAGEIADGLVGHPIWSESWLLERVQPSLRTGLAKSGRARDEFELNVGLWVATGPDRRECLEDARQLTVFYTQFEQYERYFAESGFGSEARTIRAAFQAGDTQTAANACPDEMVEHFNVVGSADEVRKRVDRVAEVADSISLMVPLGLSPEKTAAYGRRIAETFYS